jgi:hypothetical protein
VADLLECLLLLAVEAESAGQDFHFAIRQLADEQAQDAADVFVRQLAVRHAGVLVGNQLAQLGGWLVADRRVE